MYLTRLTVLLTKSPPIRPASLLFLDLMLYFAHGTPVLRVVYLPHPTTYRIYIVLLGDFIQTFVSMFLLHCRKLPLNPRPGPGEALLYTRLVTVCSNMARKYCGKSNMAPSHPSANEGPSLPRLPLNLDEHRDHIRHSTFFQTIAISIDHSFANEKMSALAYGMHTLTLVSTQG